MQYYFTPELVSLYCQFVLVFFAGIALYQIKVAKLSIVINSKRESVKLATEMIKLFLNEFIRISNKSYNFCLDKKIELIKLQGRLKEFNMEEASGKIREGVLKSAFEQSKSISKNHKQLSTNMLDEMNCLEVIAAPFVSGVADSDTGFSSIGLSFCSSVEDLWFEYVYLRSFKKGKYNYFSNTISLYGQWKSKLEINELELTKAGLEERMSEITYEDFKTIGT